MKISAMLLFLAAFQAPAFAAKAADPETVKMVRLFLKTPTGELPPGGIEAFLAVDPDALPKKLRTPYKAKRLELHTLKHLADGKKKGTIRMPEDDCAAPKQTKSDDAAVLVGAGFEEIEEHEEKCVMDRTHCLERDLMCEFSLQIVIQKRPKQEPRVRYFLHPNDPLFAIVAACREKNSAGGQTNFFGSMPAPVCSR